MKQTVFIIVSLFITIVASSKDYTFYYRHTMLAEECLLNEDFELALRHYDSAFQDYDFIFVRDCYIAAQVAAYLRKEQQAYQYLHRCMQGGLRYECLFIPAVLHLLQQTGYAEKLKNEEAICRQKYLGRIDTALNREFTYRYSLEQRAEKPGGEYYERIVMDNMSRIHELLQAGFYPGEQLIGLMNSITKVFPNDPFADMTCEYGDQLATPTLMHFSYSFDMLGEKLLEAMKEGKVHPYTVAKVFVCSKSRWYHFPHVKPSYITPLEDTYYGQIVLNMMYEKVPPIRNEKANRYRYNWFIPRLGTRHTAVTLLATYGINIRISDWFGDKL